MNELQKKFYDIYLNAYVEYIKENNDIINDFHLRNLDTYLGNNYLNKLNCYSYSKFCQDNKDYISVRIVNKYNGDEIYLYSNFSKALVKIRNEKIDKLLKL